MFSGSFPCTFLHAIVSFDVSMCVSSARIRRQSLVNLICRIVFHMLASNSSRDSSAQASAQFFLVLGAQYFRIKLVV